MNFLRIHIRVSLCCWSTKIDKIVCTAKNGWKINMFWQTCSPTTSILYRIYMTKMFALMNQNWVLRWSGRKIARFTLSYLCWRAQCFDNRLIKLIIRLIIKHWVISLIYYWSLVVLCYQNAWVVNEISSRQHKSFYCWMLIAGVLLNGIKLICCCVCSIGFRDEAQC